MEQETDEMHLRRGYFGVFRDGKCVVKFDNLHRASAYCKKNKLLHPVSKWRVAHVRSAGCDLTEEVKEDFRDFVQLREQLWLFARDEIDDDDKCIYVSEEMIASYSAHAWFAKKFGDIFERKIAEIHEHLDKKYSSSECAMQYLEDREGELFKIGASLEKMMNALEDKLEQLCTATS